MVVEPILDCTLEGAIATVTLNRPDVRNALSHELRQGIRSRIAELDANENIHAIILTGADPAFCAGFDLRELESAVSQVPEITPLAAPFISTKTPVIGAINGAAYTGGLELALSCHFLIASERATFADTHARFGLMPGWGLSVLLPEAVGVRRARQMSVSSEPIDATTALTWGLVNRVVAHEQLHAACMAIARLICSNDQNAVRLISGVYNNQATLKDEVAWQLERAAWIGASPAVPTSPKKAETNGW